MSKKTGSITKKSSLTATGILHVDSNTVGIEKLDNGMFYTLNDLLEEFADKTVNISVNSEEEYGVDMDGGA